MGQKLHQASTENVRRAKEQGKLRIVDTIVWNLTAICGLIYKMLRDRDSI